jgi:hypothetical protein
MITQKEPIKIQIKGRDIVALLSACLITGFLIKLPDIFNLDIADDLFYRKFLGWILFAGLTLYAVIRGDVSKKVNWLIVFFSFLLPGLYMLVLTPNAESDSINLVYIHIPLLMWGFYGMIRLDFDLHDKEKRIEYLRYMGDIMAFSAIILAAGLVLTLLSLALFEAIGMRIERFYMNYIVVWGLASAPIVSTFIVNNFPQVKNKLAPIIAFIFSPLALITLLIFLANLPYSGKDLFNDRSFLLVFNIMLLGVMALIVYSTSGLPKERKNTFMKVNLLLLTLVALLIDAYALSAIGFRILAFGLSPNKVAVLGSNILIFTHLILILIDLIRVNRKKATLDKVLMNVSSYLPVYFVWTLLVSFTFPLIFGMK